MIDDETIKAIYKIVDKLEQRISKLEKVLESHAKCIGEIRGRQIDEQQESGDMYGIDRSLIVFAYKTISTKELKKIIKKEEEEMEKTR